MRKVDFYFFCLYNFFYKDGAFLLKGTSYYNPLESQEKVIFGCSISFWLYSIFLRMLLFAFFYPNIHSIFISRYEFVIPVTVYGILYFYFNNTDRYVNLYRQYKETDKKLQRRVAIRILVFYGMPVILIVLLAIILMKAFNMDLRHL
jgi:hypothetical protein